MADNFIDAINLLHQKVAQAQSGTSPEDIAKMIASSQQGMIASLRKNPNATKKMTGVGKK